MLPWSCPTVPLKSSIEQRTSSNSLKENILPQKSLKMFTFKLHSCNKFTFMAILFKVTLSQSVLLNLLKPRNGQEKTVSVNLNIVTIHIELDDSDLKSIVNNEEFTKA